MDALDWYSADASYQQVILSVSPRNVEVLNYYGDVKASFLIFERGCKNVKIARCSYDTGKSWAKRGALSYPNKSGYRSGNGLYCCETTGKGGSPRQ